MGRHDPSQSGALRVASLNGLDRTFTRALGSPQDAHSLLLPIGPPIPFTTDVFARPSDRRRTTRISRDDDPRPSIRRRLGKEYFGDNELAAT
jgi:hypothetical protein